MRGRGINRYFRGIQSKKQSVNNRLCVCPKCGYSIQHIPGNPCRNNICSKCGSIMVPEILDDTREKITSNKKQERQHSNSVSESGSVVQTAKNDYPIIDAEKCTGCGTCVDVCRRQAIRMIDGVAEIITEECVNCRLCVRNCPVGAIS